MKVFSSIIAIYADRVALVEYHPFIHECQICLSNFKVGMSARQERLSTPEVWEQTKRNVLYILSDYKD